MNAKQLFVALSVSSLSLIGFAATANAASPGGPKIAVDTVDEYSSMTYRLTCYGGLPATAIVVGDGDTDLDLIVRDAYGNVVARDLGPSDRCIAVWTPGWTGTFTLEVVNHGHVYNRFVIETD